MPFPDAGPPKMTMLRGAASNCRPGNGLGDDGAYVFDDALMLMFCVLSFCIPHLRSIRFSETRLSAEAVEAAEVVKGVFTTVGAAAEIKPLFATRRRRTGRKRGSIFDEARASSSISTPSGSGAGPKRGSAEFSGSINVSLSLFEIKMEVARQVRWAKNNYTLARVAFSEEFRLQPENTAAQATKMMHDSTRTQTLYRAWSNELVVLTQYSNITQYTIMHT